MYILIILTNLDFILIKSKLGTIAFHYYKMITYIFTVVLKYYLQYFQTHIISDYSQFCFYLHQVQVFTIYLLFTLKALFKNSYLCWFSMIASNKSSN